MGFVFIGGLYPSFLQAEYREFIIEGEDRRPTRGSFEYHDIYPESPGVDTGVFRRDKIFVEDNFSATRRPLVRQPLAGFYRFDRSHRVVTGEPEIDTEYFSREHLYTIFGFVLLVLIAG